MSDGKRDSSGYGKQGYWLGADVDAGWAERQVLQSLGFDMVEVTDELVELAHLALERCYYIDRAADYVYSVLKPNLKGTRKT